jgi:hypothetical protein
MEGDIGFILSLANKPFIDGMKEVHKNLTDLHKTLENTSLTAQKSFGKIPSAVKASLDGVDKSLKEKLEGWNKNLLELELKIAKRTRTIVKDGVVQQQVTGRDAKALVSARDVLKSNIDVAEKQLALEAEKAGNKYSGGFWGGFSNKWNYEAHHFWKSHTKLEGTFSEQFQKLGDSASGKMGWAFAQGLKTLSGVFVATFAVSSIVEFVAASTEAFEKMESTAQRLKLAVGASEGTASAYKELWEQAEKLEGLAAIPKDQIVNAETMALQMGMTSEQIKQAIPVVVDFAAATGQDLGSAFNTVIMGMKGNERAVRRWGVTLTEGATWSDNLGKTLDVLNSKFKGQAEILSEATAEGRARKIEVLQDKIKENSGGFFASIHKMWQESQIATLEVVTSGYEHRSEILKKEFREHEQSFKGQEEALNPLLAEYDELVGKTDKTTEEQKRLQVIVNEIARILPGAATAWDKYGNAMGINRGKLLSELQKEKQQLLDEKNKFLAQAAKEISQGDKRAEEIKTFLNQGFEVTDAFAKVGSEYKTVKNKKNLTDERRRELVAEQDALQASLRESKQSYNEVFGGVAFKLGEQAAEIEKQAGRRILSSIEWQKLTTKELQDYFEWLKTQTSQEAQQQVDDVKSYLEKKKEEADSKAEAAAKKAIADRKKAKQEELDDALAALEQEAAIKRKNGEKQDTVDKWLRDQKQIAENKNAQETLVLLNDLKKKYKGYYEEYSSDYNDFQDKLYGLSTTRINNEVKDQEDARKKIEDDNKAALDKRLQDIDKEAALLSAPLTEKGGGGKTQEEADKYARDKRLEAQIAFNQTMSDLMKQWYGDNSAEYQKYQEDLGKLDVEAIKNRTADARKAFEDGITSFDKKIQVQVELITEENLKGKSPKEKKSAIDKSTSAQIGILKDKTSFLDAALAMGIISQDQYKEKVEEVNKKLKELGQQRTEAGLTEGNKFFKGMLKHSDEIVDALSKIGGAFSDILSAQMSKLDREMGEIQDRIQERNKTITELQSQIAEDEERQRKGYANNLTLHKKQLAQEEALRQKDLDSLKAAAKEKLALQKQQIIVDQLQTQVSFALALAKLFENGAKIGPWGVVAAIAIGASMVAAVISFINQMKAATAEAQKGFYKGGYTGDIPTTKEAGVVHGKEYVITSSKTKKMRGLLDTIHTGGTIGVDDLISQLSAGGVNVKSEELQKANTTYADLNNHKITISQISTANVEKRVQSLETHIVAIKDKLYEPKEQLLNNGTRIIRDGKTTTIIKKQ